MKETSLSISTQETPLLQDDPTKQPRIKNLKAKINFVLRILIVLIVGLIILYSIYSKNKKPEPLSPYHAGLSNYYCHLTLHLELCRDSMSSIIANATALDSNPAQIFTASLQLVADRLNRTTIAITKAARSNSSIVGPRLSACQASVSDSLSRLSRSLELLGVDNFFESWVYYVEEQGVRDEIIAVRNNSGTCLWGLREIDDEGRGVEEVKLGVEKASRLAANFISLFDGRHSVLNDYYNRYYFVENESNNFLYNYYFYFDNFYGFDYPFMVCLFCVVYLFLGLLYFLFWQGN